MKKYILLLSVLLVSCYSAPTPIVIRDIPKCDVSADMTIEEYLQSSTRWGVEMSSYTLELINQIKHKASYIDLRSQ